MDTAIGGPSIRDESAGLGEGLNGGEGRHRRGLGWLLSLWPDDQGDNVYY